MERIEGFWGRLTLAHFVVDACPFVVDACTFVVDACTFVVDACALMPNLRILSSTAR